MKKIVTLLLTMCVLSTCIACGNNNNISTNSGREDGVDISESLFGESELMQKEIEAGKSLVENSTTVFEKLPDGFVVEKEFIVGNFADAGDLQFNSFDMFSSNEIEFAYVVTNNSGKDMAYKLHIECVDKENNEIEDTNCYLPIIPNGESFVEFDSIALDADEVAKVDHLVVSVCEDTSRDISMSHEISFTAVEAPNETYPLDYMDLDITATNNSEYCANAIWMVIITYNPVDDSIEDILHMGWSDITPDEEDLAALKSGGIGYTGPRMYDIDDVKDPEYMTRADYWNEYGYFLEYDLFVQAYREQQ